MLPPVWLCEESCSEQCSAPVGVLGSGGNPWYCREGISVRGSVGTELVVYALRLPAHVFRFQATLLYTEAVHPSNKI